jgi:radical SAM-linked protein
LPLLFSSGFNPTPRVSFSQALPVGVESLVEYFDMGLAQPLASMENTVVLLNQQLPEMMEVLAVTIAPRKVAMSSVIKYEISSSSWPQEELQKRITSFLNQETFVIDRFRKNRHKDLDLRPLVTNMELNEEILSMELVSHQGQPGANPREVLEKVLGIPARESLLARIIKTSVQEIGSSS